MQSYRYPAKAPHEGQDSLVLLSPEQIRAENRGTTQRNEQNALIRLAHSIGKYGLLEPIAVLPRNDRGGFLFYELIDGERRYRAALIAGLVQIPALILSPDDVKCQRKAAVAQLLREEQHYLELAEGIATLMRDYNMTQEEIARKIKLSQSAVANKLRLLQLPLEERLLIMRMQLGERHARALLRLKNPAERKEMVAIILKNGLTVSETEQLIDAKIGKSKPFDGKTNPEKQNSKNFVAFEEIKDAFSPKKSPPPLQIPQSSEDQHHLTLQEISLRKILDTEAREASAKSTAKSEKNAPGARITPSKFALRDLRPLYTSIERTLGILKKTGVSAEYSREEDENSAKITICIPKKQA